MDIAHMVQQTASLLFKNHYFFWEYCNYGLLPILYLLNSDITARITEKGKKSPGSTQDTIK